MKPLIAIVGRPNVGKSRLFNRLIGHRRAMVADFAGTTRDRHYAPGEWSGREFIVIDTGGLDLDPNADLEGEISKQSVRAIDEADAIVCLFDGQQEISMQDRDVIDLLRTARKPVFFAVNKCDVPGREEKLAEYYRCGIRELFPISAEHGLGVDELLEAVMLALPEEQFPPDELEKGLAIAVVGRPNVGKSTLINRLAGEERVVVHETAGTTRDAIDVQIDFEGKTYTFIDTAGVKRRWGVSDRIEKWTAMRSLRTVDRATVVLQLIDAAEGITKQDLHLTGFVREQGKGLVLLANKWDRVNTNWEEYRQNLVDALGEMSDTPLMPISAAQGTGCLKIFDAVDHVTSELTTRVSTSVLNKIVQEALNSHHLPVFRGREVKIYYATQTGINPPTFALFSNYPAAVPYAYRRYLIKRIQAAIGAEDVPVRIVCRKK